MSFLKRCGIPGPKPNLLFGYLTESPKLSILEKQTQWIREYGKIVGIYAGAHPIVMVADPQLARNILVKDFSNFPDKPKAFFRLLPLEENDYECILTSSSGQRWRHLRSLANPSFNALNVNKLSESMNVAIDSFLVIMERKSKTGEEFDIEDAFQKLATDVFFRTAFGYESDVQFEENNQIMLAINQFLAKIPHKWVLLLYFSSPIIGKLIYKVRLYTERIKSKIKRTPLEQLKQFLSDIIKHRIENPDNRPNDLLQAMIDSELFDENMSTLSDEKLTASYPQNTHSIQASKNRMKRLKANEKYIRLTKSEIQTNCIFVYAAGFESSSSALAFIAHVLVNNPDIQYMIHKEVKDIYEIEGNIDYNAIQKLEYMECVIKEVLRLYPAVIPLASKECLADYKYKDITIPKGAAIAIPMYAIHHDSDYWPEPEKFDPMRFSSERKHLINPLSYQPFAEGPRNCIGRQYAMTLLKLTFARLLLHYKLEKCRSTEIGAPTLEFKLLSMCPKNGVHLKLVKIN